MRRIKKFSEIHPLFYCIVVEILILVFLIGEATLIRLISPNGNYYVQLLIQEAVGALAAYEMLKVTGLSAVLSNRGSGFGKGLLVGMYLLVISLCSAVYYVMIYESSRELQAWYLILAYIGCMFCVGLLEEFVFRGIIATLCLKKFGTQKSGIWKAVVISGVLFGLAHISNIMGCSWVGVLVQAAIASMLGMMLTAIYYRTGCIWVTVVLHALIDIAAAITTGLYGNQTMADTISSYSPLQLNSCVVYLIVVLILLRKSKMPDIEKNMDCIIHS